MSIRERLTWDAGAGAVNDCLGKWMRKRSAVGWRLYAYPVVVDYFGNDSDMARMWATFEENNWSTLVNFRLRGTSLARAHLGQLLRSARNSIPATRIVRFWSSSLSKAPGCRKWRCHGQQVHPTRQRRIHSSNGRVQLLPYFCSVGTCGMALTGMAIVLGILRYRRVR